MKKIALVGGSNFSEAQMNRLQALGEVVEVDTPAGGQERKELSQGYDVLCTNGSGVLENIYELEDVLVTYPYIELGEFDSQRLKENGVYVANTDGSNRNSIVEWTMFMVLSLFRKFPSKVNVTEDIPFAWNESLENKKVLIVGKGTIGKQIGVVCEAFHMDVDFYCRGDDLAMKSSDVDMVINCLNCNSSSKNLLDETFFMNLKQGSYYVSFARQHTFDLTAMIASLDKGILAGAAIDCDPEPSCDITNAFYQQCLHDKILVTPHIAFASTKAKENGTEFVVQNVEAYLGGDPKNILTKV